jgi:hypothetical protein
MFAGAGPEPAAFFPAAPLHPQSFHRRPSNLALIQWLMRPLTKSYPVAPHSRNRTGLVGEHNALSGYAGAASSALPKMRSLPPPRRSRPACFSRARRSRRGHPGRDQHHQRRHGHLRASGRRRDQHRFQRRHPEGRRAARRQRRLGRPGRRRHRSAGQTGQLLTFTVTNAGNGVKASRSVPSPMAAATISTRRSPLRSSSIATATAPTTPASTPSIRAAATIPSSIPTSRSPSSSSRPFPAGAGDGHRGRVDLTAVAKTGSGAPGTSFAGLGQGGGDAVVGATGADAEDDGYYRVAKASVSFVKSATVADPSAEPPSARARPSPTRSPPP